jgi:hypothetical protein
MATTMARRASWVFATGGSDGCAEDCVELSLKDRRRRVLLHDYDIQL